MVLKRLSNELVSLYKPFRVEITGMPLVVPEGFISNGNSTPRSLWSIIPPLAGEYGEAGIVHDYLYSIDSGDMYNRQDADMIHFSIGRYRGANLIKARLIYRSLRMFGESRWKKQ
jgi:hypothetical protein